MTTRTENGFSKLQIDKTTTRIANTTTTPTNTTIPVTTLFSFFAAAALCYRSSPHLLQHALPPLLPRHLLRLLILYIVCHRLIPRNHLQTHPVPSLCCYCSPSPWIHLLLKLLSSGHKRPSSIAGTTSHHPSLPSRCCCCCPPLLSTSIHLSCHRLCCCYYSNYFFSTLLTLA